MLVTDWTRETLAYRREQRQMPAAGWEKIHDNGSPLWELDRGSRQDCRIVAARPSIDGKTVWVKIERHRF